MTCCYRFRKIYIKTEKTGTWNAIGTNESVVSGVYILQILVKTNMRTTSHVITSSNSKVLLKSGAIGFSFHWASFLLQFIPLSKITSQSELTFNFSWAEVLNIRTLKPMWLEQSWIFQKQNEVSLKPGFLLGVCTFLLLGLCVCVVGGGARERTLVFIWFIE